MRGIFSAGVLDEFLTSGFDPFDLYIGVSAGACNLSSHVAGQIRRNYRLYTGLMHRPEVFSWKRFFLGGHYFDLDWFWDTAYREDRLDVWAAEENTRGKGKEFVVECTCVDTGKDVYFEPVAKNWSTMIKASSALPILYKTPLFIEGKRVVDGGVAVSIPVMEAHRRGAKRIVVIRSNPADYVKKDDIDGWFVEVLHRKDPGLVKAVRNRTHTYNQAVHFIKNPPAGIKTWHIAPPQQLKTGRTSLDLRALESDYRLGRSIGRRFIEDWT